MDIQLTIRLTERGVEVNGPISDKVLCFGLLEAAKDAIRDHIASTAAKKNGLAVVRDMRGLPGQS